MKKLILAGTGHAHLIMMMHIGKLIRARYSVTVVGPSDYLYYSGMGPGRLCLAGSCARSNPRQAICPLSTWAIGPVFLPGGPWFYRDGFLSF